MERAVSSTYLWCPFAGRGQLVPPPLAGRAVAGFLILSPSPQLAAGWHRKSALRDTRGG